MARPNKIEQHQLQKVVQKGTADGWSTRQIAAECTRLAKEQISHGAVARYLDMLNEKKAIVTKEPTRVEKIVNYDLDIIELQYRTTHALYERFQFIDGLPDMFEQRMTNLIDTVMHRDGSDPEYLSLWKSNFTDELRRNVQSITILNRELRQNSQFMSNLREKAFEFSLIQEYLGVFMDIFKRVNAEAYETAEAEIAANPRLQRIVEQQQQMRGYDEG